MAKYIPIMPVWGWYCLRARSLWFFTSSNPTISFGGFEGETKREMYEQLPPGSYPKSIYITPAFSFEETERLMQESGFEYPFAVKPDAGMMGFMFRRINNAEELQAYHQKMAVDYYNRLCNTQCILLPFSKRKKRNDHWVSKKRISAGNRQWNIYAA